jgi:hypothetical protein
VRRDAGAVAPSRDDRIVKETDVKRSPGSTPEPAANELLWPYAPALPCPECAQPAALNGLRSDGALLFQCRVQRAFMAESWTGCTSVIDPCQLSRWTTDPRVRREFVTAALALFVRDGRGEDFLIFDSATPGHYLQFMLIPEGDGQLLTEVGSRQWSCDCGVRPLECDREKMLFDLGFAPAGPARNYGCQEIPAEPDVLAELTERVLLTVYEEDEDVGIQVTFDNRETAAAFNLAWSFRL